MGEEVDAEVTHISLNSNIPAHWGTIQKAYFGSNHLDECLSLGHSAVCSQCNSLYSLVAGQ